MKVDPESPDKKIIAFSGQAIREGKLVVFPTETVYGIAANILDKDAMRRLCEIKERPKDKPFTVHIADMKEIKKSGCIISKDAGAIINKFWPGPLTIILLSKSGEKIGFRMPANKVALELIRSAKVPVAAPSANLSGKTPPVCGEDVLNQLDGKVDILIDAGRTSIGVESTVADLSVVPIKILRHGAITEEEILKAIDNG